MSQSNTGQAQAAETLTQETKTFIRQVRTKTRRKYAPGRQDPHRSGRVPSGGDR